MKKILSTFLAMMLLFWGVGCAQRQTDISENDVFTDAFLENTESVQFVIPNLTVTEGEIDLTGKSVTLTGGKMEAVLAYLKERTLRPVEDTAVYLPPDTHLAHLTIWYADTKYVELAVYPSYVSFGEGNTYRVVNGDFYVDLQALFNRETEAKVPNDIFTDHFFEGATQMILTVGNKIATGDAMNPVIDYLKNLPLKETGDRLKGASWVGGMPSDLLIFYEDGKKVRLIVSEDIITNIGANGGSFRIETGDLYTGLSAAFK